MLTTRKPTGRPPFPVVLLAGVEKSGKTYEAARASASDLIRDAYWISFGEQEPDEYGQLGNFAIVQHESTYRDLLRAIDDINRVEPGDKPDLLIIDSMSPVWGMLKDETQEAAWRRAKAKADRSNQRFDKLADEVKPPMDLWNLAAQRWQHIMDAVREHRGPVVLTARLDEVNVIGRNDQPTGEKAWSIQAHKSLPSDVSAIVEFRGYRKALVRGVRSLRWKADPDALVPVNDFTVESLWRAMGIEDAAAQDHHPVDAAKSLDSDDALAKNRAAILHSIGADMPEDARRKLADEWLADHGHPINETSDIAGLMKLRDSLKGSG